VSAPFPRTFYVANSIELFERLAYYGTFVGLSLYLTNVVGFGDVATGTVLGAFRLVNTLVPIPCGALADRITFRRSLVAGMSSCAVGYLLLFLTPQKGVALAALLFMAVGGGLIKPVITGTVVRTAPPGRQTEGFAVFYRMVNAGSVLGKSLAYGVRVIVSLRYVMIDAVVASLAAVGLAAFAYEEPEKGRHGGSSGPTLKELAREWASALKNARFATFLVVVSGYYFMIDQFYFTFPKYVTRHIDPKAPLEMILLINPALISLFQNRVTRATVGRAPLTMMSAAFFVASASMLVMGAIPTLVGACLSGALFALAEMIFAPRFYEYIASFAAEGKAGLYMGLSLVPGAIGVSIGGYVSGRLVAAYLPQGGPTHPFTVWSTYAALGVGCGVVMLGYRTFAHAAPDRRPEPHRVP
jgi:dipeptide/tripeptide permease